MNSGIKKLSQGHLLNIIKTTKDHHPNFTLFLGAGTSVTSSVKTATEMIEEWRNTYTEIYSEEELKAQHWYNRPTEYSELFEELYDQPSQRREFIESCICDASPSWGYIYLVNLFKNSIFNTVFTTNFDDLLNEACYMYSSNTRPIVCAHDSSINSVRLTSSRPKIIKLHGDFLFDDIKNTVRELESLEINTREKFRQFSSEFGMIVLGYAGNDRSIMDTLNTLLRSDNYFPHGIYWCIRKNSSITEQVINLARFPKFKIVEIDGFDEFLAELNSELKLGLQEEIAEPYNALAKKLDNFFPSHDIVSDEDDDELSKKSSLNLTDNAVIQSDIQLLRNHVKNYTERLSNDSINEINESIDKCDAIEDEDISKLHRALNTLKANEVSLPYNLVGQLEFMAKHFDDALISAHKSLKHGTSFMAVKTILDSVVNGATYSNIPNLQENLVTSIKELNDENCSKLMTSLVALIEGEKYELPKLLLQKMHEKSAEKSLNDSHVLVLINLTLIYKLDSSNIPDNISSLVEKAVQFCIETGNLYFAFGLFILADEVDAAIDILIHTKNMPLINKILEGKYKEPIRKVFPGDFIDKLKVAIEANTDSDADSVGNIKQH